MKPESESWQSWQPSVGQWVKIQLSLECPLHADPRPLFVTAFRLMDGHHAMVIGIGDDVVPGHPIVVRFDSELPWPLTGRNARLAASELEAVVPLDDRC